MPIVNYCNVLMLRCICCTFKMVVLQEMSSMEAIEEQKTQEDGEPSVTTEKEGG